MNSAPKQETIMPKDDLCERLRTAWMTVQQAKREGKFKAQPVWDIVNAVPEVVAILDKTEEFEQDAEIERLRAKVEMLQSALKEIYDFCPEGFTVSEIARTALEQDNG